MGKEISLKGDTMDEKSKVTVTQLPNSQTLIIRQVGARNIFVSSDNVIVIEIPALSFLLSFLVKNKYISKKILEGILSELSE
jgi:hypothetical protein